MRRQCGKRNLAIWRLIPIWRNLAGGNLANWRIWAMRRINQIGESPNGPQMGPKWAQMGPKRAPNGPQMGPKWAPNGPQIGPKWAPNGPQLGPKWGPNGSQMGPKWAPNGAQMGPTKITILLKRKLKTHWVFPIRRNLAMRQVLPHCLRIARTGYLVAKPAVIRQQIR